MAEKDYAGVLGLAAVGGLAATGLFLLWRQSKFQTAAGGTRAAIATGRAEWDAYDAALSTAIDASGPMAVRNARLIKALAMHETAGFQPRYAEGVHTDGVSWGLTGLNARYFEGDLADPFHNARLGVGYLMVQLSNAGGNVDLALSRYNAGPRSGVTAYASNVLARVAQLYPAGGLAASPALGSLRGLGSTRGELVRHASEHLQMQQQGITAAALAAGWREFN